MPRLVPVERPRTVVSTSASSAISNLGRVLPRVTAYGLTSAPVGSSRSGIVTAHPIPQPRRKCLLSSMFWTDADVAGAVPVHPSTPAVDRGAGVSPPPPPPRGPPERHLVAPLADRPAARRQDGERRPVGDRHQEEEPVVHLDHCLQ